MPFGQRASLLQVHCVLSWQPFTKSQVFSPRCQHIAWHPVAHSAKQEWHWEHCQPRSVQMSVRLAVGGVAWEDGGSDKQIVPCQTRLVGGQSWKSLHRPQWGSTSMKKCDVMRGNAFWETDLLVTAAKQGSAQDTRHTETWSNTKMIMASIIKKSPFPPCRFVCDERSHHLHSDESRMGAGGKFIWLLLHPGVGGLPLGADQRTHLCHLEEARMSRHSIPLFPVTPPTPPNCKCYQYPSEV